MGLCGVAVAWPTRCRVWNNVQGVGASIVLECESHFQSFKISCGSPKCKLYEDYGNSLDWCQRQPSMKVSRKHAGPWTWTLPFWFQKACVVWVWDPEGMDPLDPGWPNEDPQVRVQCFKRASPNERAWAPRSGPSNPSSLELGLVVPLGLGRLPLP